MAQKSRDETTPLPLSEREKTTPRSEIKVSARSEIDGFLARLKSLKPTTVPGRRGRLVFALDATMSRQPTWDTACKLQADMFKEAASVGGLDVQLVYFRGLAECRASSWVSEPKRLAGLMERIDWRGGHPPISRGVTKYHGGNG